VLFPFVLQQIERLTKLRMQLAGTAAPDRQPAVLPGTVVGESCDDNVTSRPHRSKGRLHVRGPLFAT